MRSSVSTNIKKKIIEADNRVDAVKLFQQYKPDLTILDIFMPRADGLQALQALNKINIHAKIIITTASENMKFAEQSKKRHSNKRCFVKAIY
ncbi:MAG: response regulator [Candidatus Nitrosotenuis sp.]|nr:MAG: response regulator [Candidatus Nitrosotenuis sp.]